MTVLQALDEYVVRLPQEAAELAPIIATLRESRPDELADRLWCQALLRDDDGRVFQRKSPESGAWLVPGGALGSDGNSMGEAAARALAAATGLGDHLIAQVLDHPIEVAPSATGLRVYFVMTTTEALPLFAPKVAATARWAPTDFLWNERLATKLTRLA